MDPVRRLFHELADLPPAERARVLAEREVEPEVRAEVESLLSFDSTEDHLLTGGVSEAAEEVLQSAEMGAGQIGPYRLVRSLGSGGMGAVYLAERTDGELQQQVAIKFLLAGADRPAWRERFLKERQLLASLNHAAIARVIDAGRTGDGRPYLVMEYVDGVPIDIYAAGKDLREVLSLFLRVCDGVSHAHSRLIIHRDLKPSNILVDAAGQPKLLDFGIAKLLDDHEQPTQTVERLHTPGYSSPEQLRGDAQTTATDVYSLGAVLQKLLPGPVPKDIECILRRALRAEPEERYASVEALASDLQAFLESRPVEARSGNAWYHTRKFLRRYWVPVSAAAVAIAGLAAGLGAARRQEAVANQRFMQVRRLSQEVLGLDQTLMGIPGTGEARHKIVAMSAGYLEGLGPEARKDPELALETGEAYISLARAQGIPVTPNLGQHAEAGQSLKKADALLEAVLAASPRNLRALVAAAEANHNLMILAQTDHRNAEALSLGRKAVARTDRALALGEVPADVKSKLEVLLINVGLAHKNMHLYEAAIRYERRAIDLARSWQGGGGDIGAGLSVIADAMRLSGRLDDALAAIREAHAYLEKGIFQTDHQRYNTTFNTLWREGLILGQEGGISLGRGDEAVQVLQKALDTLQEWSQKASGDSNSRIMYASAGRELGAILTPRDPRRALAVYDLSISRLREIPKNTKARRGEAQLLAGSSYALRRLQRNREAQERLDAAFRILAVTKDYPADRISPDDEAQAALRALADHLAHTGQPIRAAAVYQELLDKMAAGKIDPENDLSHAAKLSSIYQSIGLLHQRNGHLDQAKAASSRRTALWRHWEARLPGNSYVRRQLEAAVR